MTKLFTSRTSLTLALFLGGALSAFAQEAQFRATLSGPESSAGQGSLTLTSNEEHTALIYRLTYTGMDSPDVGVIRVALPGDRGGVAVVLCGAADRPACPANGATLTGVITAENIRAVPSMSLPAHDMSAFVRLLQTSTGVAVVRDVEEGGPAIAGQIHPVGD